MPNAPADDVLPPALTASAWPTSERRRPGPPRDLEARARDRSSRLHHPRAENADGPFAALDTVEATIGSFTDAAAPGHPLRNGVTYHYRVALSGGGRGGERHRHRHGAAEPPQYRPPESPRPPRALLRTRSRLHAASGEAGHAGRHGFRAQDRGTHRHRGGDRPATEMGRAVLYVPGIDDANKHPDHLTR